jgi:hypothetical protein
MNDNVMYVDEMGNQVAPPMMNYPPVQTQRGEKADLLDKIKPDAIVETIRHKLIGEELVNGKWVKIPQLQRRAISEEGAWDIANLMLGVSSQNVALSKLNDHEIRNRTMEIIRTAQKLMLKNWKEYGISGSDQLEYVHQIVMSNTFITLKQPENGGIRDLIKNTTQENIIHNQEQRKAGWAKKLLGFG